MGERWHQPRKRMGWPRGAFPDSRLIVVRDWAQAVRPNITADAIQSSTEWSDGHDGVPADLNKLRYPTRPETSVVEHAGYRDSARKETGT